MRIPKTVPMTSKPLAGVSILVVEDHCDGRDVVETYLRFAGATVRSTPSAEEALDLFKASLPAVVLTDVAMPGHDGVWLLKQIRSLPGVPRVPVIALTALVMPHERERLRAEGFDTQIGKPADLDDIVRIIREVIAPTSGTSSPI